MEKTRLFSENNRQGCQNCSPRVQGDLLKNFFGKKLFFYFIIGHWASFFVISTKFLSVGSTVLLSVCQLHQFVLKFFVSKNFFSQQFWILIANLSVFVQVFFNQVDDTVFYESERSIWRQTIVLTKFFISFFILREHWTKKNGFFGGKQLAGLSNLLTICQGNPLKSFFVQIGSFFAHHWHLTDFLSGFSTKTSLRCRQNCFVSVHCNNLW